MDRKLCSKCRKEKPAADFPRCSRNKSGLDTYCRACRSEISAVYYAKNKGRILAKASQWAKDHPERMAELASKYYRRRYKKITPEEWAKRRADRAKAKAEKPKA